MKSLMMIAASIVLMVASVSMAQVPNKTIHCTAIEAGMGFNYLTKIVWLDAKSAKVDFSIVSNGQEIPVCQAAKPFSIRQNGVILNLDGAALCQGKPQPQTMNLVLNTGSMQLKVGPRIENCQVKR